MATTRLMTAEDVVRLQMDNDVHYELIEGELERMSPATPEHAWIETRFASRVGNHVESHSLGTVFGSSAGYFFGHEPDTLLEPDFTFIRADRVPPSADWRAFFEVVPDLVIEIISPSERRAHIDRKVAIYLTAGVRPVWFVDPWRRTVTVYAPNQEPFVLGDAQELDGRDVLPGLRFPIASIFPPSRS